MGFSVNTDAFSITTEKAEPSANNASAEGIGEAEASFGSKVDKAKTDDGGSWKQADRYIVDKGVDQDKTVYVKKDSQKEEIHDGIQDLDGELFDLEQGGEVTQEQIDDAKSKLDELKDQTGGLPDDHGMIRPAIYTGVPDKTGLEGRIQQLEGRIDRLQDVADGKDVTDRMPEGAIRVDHEYGEPGGGHLMDTAMVSLGNDADGYEQFVAFSPNEQTEANVYYRDEVGNFTSNRNEAVKEFDGIATDPSILPDNAIRGNDGGYYRASREDDSGVQVFRRIDDDPSMRRSGPAEEFYMTQDGDFKVLQGDLGIKELAGVNGLKEGALPVSAEQFEKMEWEPQLPEGAVAVNVDGDSRNDFYMVSIGEGPDGQERFVAVQEDGARNYGLIRPDQQIYVKDEDGNFESLDGEPLSSPEPLDEQKVLDALTSLRES